MSEPAFAQPSDPNDAFLYNRRLADPSGDVATTLIQPSMFTGAATLAIPIAGPPGTGGVEPQLALQYNSRRSRGTAGVGWSVNLPKIVRSTRYGTDKTQEWSASTAIYELGGVELIKGSGENDPFGCAATRYFTEVERFQKIFYCTTTDYWVLLERDGTRKTFGKLAANNSKLADGGTTFEYYLDEVMDTHSLLWQAHYSAYGDVGAASAPRLEKVEYTFFSGAGVSPVGAIRRIDLQWGLRADGTPEAVDWRYKIPVSHDRRISAIEVELEYTTGIERVRRYVLAYTDSPDNDRSLLDTAQLLGKNDTDQMPTMDFDYQFTNPPPSMPDNYPGFDTSYSVIAGPTGWPGWGLQDQDGDGNLDGELRDINGDGHLDLVEVLDIPTAKWRVWFGNGDAAFDGPVQWVGAGHKLREITTDASGAPDVTVEFIDMNGDGRPDLYKGGTTSGTLYLNTGSGFTALTWSNPGSTIVRDYDRDATHTYTVADLIDVNGDGCPDRVWVGNPGTPQAAWYVNRNRMCEPTPVYGFGSTTQIYFRTQGIVQPPQYLGQTASILTGPITDPYKATWTKDGFSDFNGDGLPDFYWGDDPGGPSVWMGSGRDFHAEVDTTFAADILDVYDREIARPFGSVNPTVPPLSVGFPGGLHLAFVDLNKDGFVDWVESNMTASCTGRGCSPWNAGHSDHWYVWFGTGRGINRNFESWIAKDNTTPLGAIQAGGNPEQRVVDLDASGLVDFVKYDASSDKFRLFRDQNKKPDYLELAKNGVGGETRMEYGAMVGAISGTVGGEGMAASTLHFPVTVVNKITTTDSLYTVSASSGAEYVTDLTYWTAYYDRTRRTFRGFGTVEANRSDNMGTPASYSRHYFAMGDISRTILASYPPTGTQGWADHWALAGRRFGTKSGPNAATILSESWRLSQAVAQPTGSIAPQLKRRRGLTRQNPGTDIRWTETELFYGDSYGNVTKAYDYGQLDSTGTTTYFDDERYVFFTYALNATKHIVSLLSEVEITSDTTPQPTTLRHHRFYYDGNTTLGVVDTGDLTRSEEWVAFENETPDWAETNFTRDTYGNALTIAGAEDGLTNLTWEDDDAGTEDSFVYLHKSEIEVAAGKGVGQEVTLTSTATWHEGTANVLESKGPNGNRVVNTLDGLGRVIKVEASPPSDPLGALVTLSDLTYFLDGASGSSTNNYVKRVDHFDTGVGDTVESRVYLDGLMRPVQSKSEAEGTNWSTLSTRYTQFGPDRQTIPYFTSVATYSNFPHWDPDPQPASTHRRTVDWAGRTLTQKLHATDGTDHYLTSMAYDLWHVTVTNPLNVDTVYDHEVRGLLRVDQKDDGGVTQAQTFYEYDRLGNLTLVRDNDAPANNWQMAYDSRGLRRRLIDPDLSNCATPSSCPWEYKYDLEGRLTEQMDPNDDKIVLSFDEIDRVFKRDYQCTACSDIDVDYEFDDATYGLGLISKMTRGIDLETTFAYDAWQRESSITDKIVTSTKTTSFAYDLFDRLTTLTYPSSKQAAYTYGPSGTATVTYDSATILSAATYDARGRATQLDWGNGLTSHRSWANHEKTNQIRVTDTVDLLDMTYLYDAAGNTTQIIEDIGDWRREYDYDWNQRLLEGRHYVDSTAILQKTWTYTYAALGNMTYNSEWDVGGSDGTYDYSGSSAGPHAVTKVGGASSTYTFAYDTRGNMTSENGSTIAYGYDLDSRMTSVSDTGQTPNPNLALTYDGTGSRVRREWTEPGPTDHEIRYFGAHYEERIEGASTYDDHFVVLNGTRIAHVTTEQAGKVFYLHSDVQGTVGLITDEMKAVVERRTYGPYGDLYTITGGGSGVRDGYSGAEHDGEVALVHLGVRQHHPLLARWPHPDALIPNPSNPQSFNRYAYAHDNPVTYTDPSGYTPKPCGPEDDCEGDVITVTAKWEGYAGPAGMAFLSGGATTDAGQHWLAYQQRWSSEIDKLRVTSTTPASGGRKFGGGKFGLLPAPTPVAGIQGEPAPAEQAKILVFRWLAPTGDFERFDAAARRVLARDPSFFEGILFSPTLANNYPANALAFNLPRRDTAPNFDDSRGIVYLKKDVLLLSEQEIARLLIHETTHIRLGWGWSRSHGANLRERFKNYERIHRWIIEASEKAAQDLYK